MTGQVNMNPELVYQLVASNPNLKNLVEQTARLQQLQVQAQQMAPVLQQMAQNPAGALTGYANWQAAQAAPQPQEAPQNQQGGRQVGMYDQLLNQALGLVEEFRGSIGTLNNNLKEIHDMCAANADAVGGLTERVEKLSAAAKAKNADGPGKGA